MLTTAQQLRRIAGMRAPLFALYANDAYLALAEVRAKVSAREWVGFLRTADLRTFLLLVAESLES